MRERILLVPGLNGNELIKNLALYNVKCFNLRIVTGSELAQMALIRSGIAVKEEFIDTTEEITIISKAIKGIRYFDKPTYSDLSNITSAIRRMRSLVTDPDETKVIEDTLSEGMFKTKNDALIKAYKEYMRILKDKSCIDSVSLIRKAIAECTSFDAEFEILKEYPLNPVESALIQKVSDGKANTISINDLYNASDKPIKISSYKNCYGASNEVETIITDIYSGKNTDDCTVVVTDPATYGQLFLDYALMYDIPVTFGCGIPIMNSNPAKLLVLYYNWMTSGFFGSTSIKAMLTSDAFDRGNLPLSDEEFSWNVFYELLCQIRYTNDINVNLSRYDKFKKALMEDGALIDEDDTESLEAFHEKELCLESLRRMAYELSLLPEEFITKYSYLRKSKNSNSEALLSALDSASVKGIADQLAIIRKAEIDQSLEDIIRSILATGQLSQQSEPGKIHITTVDKAAASVRKNMYIAEMSATRFPGSPKENYLLLDEELRAFGSPAERFTSAGRIMANRDHLLELVRLASGLESDIQVSYAGLNVSELKQENASSLIYELYKEEHGNDITYEQLMKNIKTVEYFEPKVSIGRYIGKAYLKKNLIPTHTHNNAPRQVAQDITEREFSPSALDKYVGCPRKFMLRYIIGLHEPDEDDPFLVIAPNEEGVLLHSLMELLADPATDKDKFMQAAEEYFDRYIAEHTPLIPDNVKDKRTQFLEMADQAYESDPHREIILKEEDIHKTHECGIRLYGYPDRVEKLEDGSCIIVDYKTSHKERHAENDPASCLQVLIYAYLMEQSGYKVSHCEYRYVRLEKTIRCEWNEETKSELDDILTDFKEHMENGYFPTFSNFIPNVKDFNPCEHCKYGLVCGKGV
ncbi:PD-(D/E)XK nuclease family protein [Butyrivibrio sp. AE2032]|uniref:PD-(D/E)XK nuclease family protein n=1 Tax=Butyrivibrio sp. AE2032 TaxID=1458463 RepID=UPI00054D1F6F|nr:PD-(D/E)XK nuclease family protein [Butyrivibrio sp. AE2032]